MPAYDFNDPADVAKYLKTLRKQMGQQEWARFAKEKTPEFLKQVKIAMGAK